MNTSRPNRLYAFVVGTIFLMWPIFADGSCVIGPPIVVRQVCGELSWANAGNGYGHLRIVRKEQRGEHPFEKVLETTEDGKFAFGDLPGGEYELYVSPVELREIAVPVILKVRKPLRNDACVVPLLLRVDSLPESCVSAKLKGTPKDR